MSRVLALVVLVALVLSVEAASTQRRRAERAQRALLMNTRALRVNAQRILAGHKARGFDTADHVLIIGCDGFGWMYLNNATDNLPNIKRLMDDGVVATAAHDQLPTISGPNWSTLLTGVNPKDRAHKEAKESMFTVAKAQNPEIKTACSYSWSQIKSYIEPKNVDYSFSGNENDASVASAMTGFIKAHKPELMFAHFDAIDKAGHHHGWGSDEYYAAAKTVDDHVGELLSALSSAGIKSRTLVILTADHGGKGHDHEAELPIVEEIPAIFYGSGAKDGVTVSDTISNKDFAPTALNALGLKPGQYMHGNVLSEIY